MKAIKEGCASKRGPQQAKDGPRAVSPPTTTTTMFDTTGRRVWGPEHERKLASEIRKEKRRLQAILTAADDLLARSNPRLPAGNYIPVLND